MNVFSGALISVSLPSSFPVSSSLLLTTAPLTLPHQFILVAPTTSRPLASAFSNAELHSATSWAQSSCWYSDMLSCYMERCWGFASAWNRILLKLKETFIHQNIRKAKTQQQCPNTTSCSYFSEDKGPSVRKGGNVYLTPKSHFCFGLILQGVWKRHITSVHSSPEWVALTLQLREELLACLTVKQGSCLFFLQELILQMEKCYIHKCILKLGRKTPSIILRFDTPHILTLTFWPAEWHTFLWYFTSTKHCRIKFYAGTMWV